MRSFGWVLTIYGILVRRRDDTNSHRGHVKTQGEDGHPQTKEVLWEENSPADALISDPWAPEPWGDKLLLFQAAQYALFCYGSPRKWKSSYVLFFRTFLQFKFALWFWKDKISPAPNTRSTKQDLFSHLTSVFTYTSILCPTSLGFKSLYYALSSHCSSNWNIYKHRCNHIYTLS